MGTKADFITALGGATTPIGTVKTFTATHGTDVFTVTAHGLTTGYGPFRLSSTGDLPAGLGPNKANNGLTFTPGTIADDVIRVDDVYYQFAADPTTGTPDGTVAAPYLVDVGGTATTSLANLLAAINASGTPGTTYSEEIDEAHATVEATASDATTVSLRARTAGTAGNAITLAVTGNDGIAANAALFSGGLAAVDYYAIVVDDDTIQIALTAGGAAVTFTDNGTGTHSIGANAQGLADAIDDFLVGHLTSPGNRVQPQDVNVSKFWDALLATIV